jgi:hypothetical protein
MSSSKTLTRSFAGGEITPEMYGRLDNVKFQTGLALCLNAYVLPHGPVAKRPGTGYVNAAGNSSYAVRMLPFAFSADQTMAIEAGHAYLKFHTQGATLQAAPSVYSGATAYSVGDSVSSAGSNYYCIAATTGNAPPNASYWYLMPGTDYKIPSPYAAADLFNLRYTQSADVLTITCVGYAPRELRRLGASKWVLSAPALGATVSVPGTPTVVTTAGTGTPYVKNIYYRVTAVSSDGKEESLPNSFSAPASIDLSLPGAKNAISWTASSLAGASYRVYKAVNDGDKLYGFIGETIALTFTDDNITPDYSLNPPSSTLRLDTANNYPTAVSYFEQRRVFGGTTNNPQAVYMTRVGTESNLTVSNPSSADDALSFSVKAQQQNAVRHLMPLNDLLVLTAGGVWRVAATSGALVPETLSTKPQTFYGSNNVTPALTGHSCLYVEKNGRRVRDIGYSWESQAYTSDDRSIIAPHLFLDYEIVDMAYMFSPDQLLWCVRSDGKMLSMAYVPEHQVYGWSQHSTAGYFESACVVTENNEDVMYVVVLRNLNGSNVRCIERMASRRFATQSDGYFIDCGLTYDGAPATTISGLGHLEGESVAVLADGAVVEGLTVTGGSITLPSAASIVHIGLPYTMDVQLLPVSIDTAEAGGQGTVKAVDYAYLRVNRSGPVFAGPAFDDLTQIPIRTNEPYGAPPRLQSRTLDVFINPDLSQDAQLCLRSASPTPLTISSISLKVTLGG